MKGKRKQLTLFLNPKETKVIEKIRHKFNPAQFELIKSHITLCREDEIEDLSAILQTIEQLNISSFELELGKVERFWEGKGVFIPIKDEHQKFQHLRALVLSKVTPSPRFHEPHITLMHPRNSCCTDNIFEQIQTINLPTYITISTISLIEQEIGKTWHVLKEYNLLG